MAPEFLTANLSPAIPLKKHSPVIPPYRTVLPTMIFSSGTIFEFLGGYIARTLPILLGLIFFSADFKKNENINLEALILCAVSLIITLLSGERVAFFQQYARDIVFQKKSAFEFLCFCSKCFKEIC